MIGAASEGGANVFKISYFKSKINIIPLFILHFFNINSRCLLSPIASTLQTNGNLFRF